MPAEAGDRAEERADVVGVGDALAEHDPPGSGGRRGRGAGKHLLDAGEPPRSLAERQRAAMEAGARDGDLGFRLSRTLPSTPLPSGRD